MLIFLTAEWRCFAIVSRLHGTTHYRIDERRRSAFFMLQDILILVTIIFNSRAIRRLKTTTATAAINCIKKTTATLQTGDLTTDLSEKMLICQQKVTKWQVMKIFADGNIQRLVATKASVAFVPAIKTGIERRSPQPTDASLGLQRSMSSPLQALH